MTYFYDNYGWLSDSGRATSIDPKFKGSPVVGELYPNFSGIEWQLCVYAEPPAPDMRPARREAILAELAKIDADTTKPRTLRELSIGVQATIDWVAAQDAKAVALRAELNTL